MMKPPRWLEIFLPRWSSNFLANYQKTVTLLGQCSGLASAGHSINEAKEWSSQAGAATALQMVMLDGLPEFIVDDPQVSISR
jgi:hypothetical protein